LAGADFASLSTLEQLWAKWYIYMGDPVLATGIMSFVLHEVVYFGRCLPWVAIDRIPYFRQWKIQETKVPSAADQWKCTKLVLLTHFTVELPQIWGFHPFAEYMGITTHQVPFPALSAIVGQVILFFFLEDLWHYTFHRAMHRFPVLYKNIHKLHHEFSAPFGLAAEYAHPIEILTLGFGSVVMPILACKLLGLNLHLITMYTFIVLRLFQAVDAHSGYDFPWSLHHFFPIWAGADHHDFHHMNFIGCYSSSFRIWDYIFDSEASYKAYKKRQAEAKRLGKGKAATFELDSASREQQRIAKAK